MASLPAVWSRDWVPSVELRRCLCLTCIPTHFVQRRARWFGYTARRPDGELIRDALRTRGQLKALVNLEPPSGLQAFGFDGERTG